MRNTFHIQNKLIYQLYLDIIEEDEFPSMEVSTDSNVHVLNSCPLQPTTGFLQSLNSPDTSSSIEPEEVQEHAINLLLYLKMKSQIDVLQPR